MLWTVIARDWMELYTIGVNPMETQTMGSSETTWTLFPTTELVTIWFSLIRSIPIVFAKSTSFLFSFDLVRKHGYCFCFSRARTICLLYLFHLVTWATLALAVAKSTLDATNSDSTELKSDLTEVYTSVNSVNSSSMPATISSRLRAEAFSWSRSYRRRQVVLHRYFVAEMMSTRLPFLQRRIKSSLDILENPLLFWFSEEVGDMVEEWKDMFWCCTQLYLGLWFDIPYRQNNLKSKFSIWNSRKLQNLEIPGKFLSHIKSFFEKSTNVDFR